MGETMRLPSLLNETQARLPKGWTLSARPCLDPLGTELGGLWWVAEGWVSSQRLLVVARDPEELAAYVEEFAQQASG